MNEFNGSAFSADKDKVQCSIGESSFREDAADYGSGYILRIDLITAGKRRIQAEIEWLSVESDLSPEPTGSDAIMWNLVAPRSDVSGRITQIGKRANIRKMVHFRGTGCHHHLRSIRSAAEMPGPRCWGLAHFKDATVVFQHIATKNGDPRDKLYLIRGGMIDLFEARTEFQKIARDRYGFKVPGRLAFLSDGEISLTVKPIRPIQPGFFETKMLSQVTLTLGDDVPRTATGLTVFSDPARMKHPLLRLISNLRTRLDRRSPFY